MRHEHRALCQHNSKKNSRKYVKISKINKYIRIRYNLKIGIPDFLWRNICDNRLPQTSPQVTDVATWGDWEAGTHLYSNFQNGGKKWVIRGTILSIIVGLFEHNSNIF